MGLWVVAWVLESVTTEDTKSTETFGVALVRGERRTFNPAEMDLILNREWGNGELV